jgi:hypothetical protein
MHFYCLLIMFPSPPLAEIPLPKRQRFDNHDLKGLTQFWKSLWVDKVNPVQVVDVRRDPDSVGDVTVPTTMKVLRGLPKEFASVGVLVREEYDRALLILEQYCVTQRGVIIVGHSGIGMANFWSLLASMGAHI